MIFFWMFFQHVQVAAVPTSPNHRILNASCLKNSMRLPIPIPTISYWSLQPIEAVELTYAFRIQPDPSPIALDESTLHLGSILQDTSTQCHF